MGFIGVGQGSRPFLAFWKERLLRECINNPHEARFVDQRWVDFVPGMFDQAMVRDPQYNVAYWNLHSRWFRWTGEHYEVDGHPLAFFHFSGYSPEAPHRLSMTPRVQNHEYSLAKIPTSGASAMHTQWR